MATRYKALQAQLNIYISNAEPGEGVSTSSILRGLRKLGMEGVFESNLNRHLRAIGAKSRKRAGKNALWEWYFPQ